MFHPTKPFAVLDLGNTRVCAIIARINAHGELDVLGIGEQFSKGFKKGHIVDRESFEISILNAVHAAEEMSGETIEEVIISLTGSLSSHVIDVDLPIGGREVEEKDIEHLLAHVQDHLLYRKAEGQSSSLILHAFPIGYTVDGNKGVKDPRGMFCERLGLSLHVVTYPFLYHKNLVMCLARCHLVVVDAVAAPYAAALSTLVPDEKELGATLIDMGGNTTSYAVFLDGYCVALGSIPIGGEHITTDIAQGLSTSRIHAERLKTLYGGAVSTVSDEKETILVPQIGEGEYTMQITKGSLNYIIRPRVEEIFEILKKNIDEVSWAKSATRRIVLTGGASQLSGVRELLSSFLTRQVRLATPLAPEIFPLTEVGANYATVLGLLEFAQEYWKENPRKKRFSFKKFNLVNWFKKSF